MATGWAKEGAVQEQIDSTIEDALARIRSRIPSGESRSDCQSCSAEIPLARRQAVPGVSLCVACQEERDADDKAVSGYNRRGSKDSQLR